MNKTGLAQLQAHLGPGKTAAFLGSSGVGKSTIINGLLGYERQRVQEVMEQDDRGKHTTTFRELIVMPEGGILIDTPGLRGILLWAEEDDVRKTFEDIENLAAQCRFRDCSHNTEPDCAVRAALENGTLTQGRWESYRKQLREMRYLAKKQNLKEKRRQEREWDKKIRQHLKQLKDSHRLKE